MADVEESNVSPQNYNSEWYTSSEQNQIQETAISLDDTTASLAQTDTMTSVKLETTDESQPPQFFNNFKSQLNQEMAGQLWQAGKQSTQKFINSYAHIDILRPYFDIEPSQFRDRLLYSFIPNLKVDSPQEICSELYGPTMLVFTLVAVLLYGMKTSGHTVEDGSLIGTALVVCISYWLGVSFLVFFISFLFTAHFSLFQVISLIGYSLSAHCLILMLSTFFDHYGIPKMFYVFWLIIGTLTTLKQAGIFISRTWTLRDGIVLTVLTGFCHLTSILYLRFAYHRVYEAISGVI